MRIFVAGASGAIGRQLVPMLLAAGHDVTGTTRHADRAAAMRRQGASAVVVDAMDRASLVEAVVRAAPTVVIHQLTDLAAARTRGFTPEVLAANALLRQAATANLAAATEAAGAGRMVAQSAAWLYAAGPEPHGEDDPLAARNESERSTLQGIETLERVVLGSTAFDGIVLRYGLFYGPGTGTDTPAQLPSVGVSAAARAALLAMDHGAPGIYNVVDDIGPVSNARARRELGWSPD